ncbi:MAG TPA: dehydrogenase, partial [Porphyromonadaceae bacterium]|nr:dehydrogenase [Porphyromonadaceae bacterium]
MDIEDAHKLHLITTDKAIELLLGFFDGERRDRRTKNLSLVSDINEQIAYLRASVIGMLVDECAQIFLREEEAILAGTFRGTLIKRLSEKTRIAYNT